jgi:hypothetical protein
MAPWSARALTLNMASRCWGAIDQPLYLPFLGAFVPWWFPKTSRTRNSPFRETGLFPDSASP